MTSSPLSPLNDPGDFPPGSGLQWPIGTSITRLSYLSATRVLIVFIATYAGRVSCVVFSSPHGLPSDSTQCSPTKDYFRRNNHFAASVVCLSPVGLLVHIRLTSELLRFL